MELCFIGLLQLTWASSRSAWPPYSLLYTANASQHFYTNQAIRRKDTPNHHHWHHCTTYYSKQEVHIKRNRLILTFSNFGAVCGLSRRKIMSSLAFSRIRFFRTTISLYFDTLHGTTRKTSSRLFVLHFIILRELLSSLLHRPTIITPSQSTSFDPSPASLWHIHLKIWFVSSRHKFIIGDWHPTSTFNRSHSFIQRPHHDSANRYNIFIIKISRRGRHTSHKVKDK